MLKKLRLLMGADPPPKALIDSSRVRSVRRSPMTEAYQEIAVYVHRFHNLDLFQQGWYQIKISMAWEDNDDSVCGFPARVVQYEAPESLEDDTVAVWKINDSDQSFYTRPFRIKFSRQDVFLSVMVAFNLPVKGTLGYAALMKFELLYAPLLDDFEEVQDALDNFSASVHQIRIPPTALLGLHCYCPLNFDSFHTVLVDLTVHIVLLKAASTSSRKHAGSEDILLRKMHQGFGAAYSQKSVFQSIGVSSQEIVLWKALFDARNLIIKESQKLSTAINKKFDIDMTESSIIQSVSKKLDDLSAQEKALRYALRTEQRSKIEKSTGQLVGRLERIDSKTLKWSQSLKAEMQEGIEELGSLISATWNEFLRFHREHRLAITDYLRQAWADDRSTEWSLWMVHSKIGLARRMTKYGSFQHLSLAGKTLTKRCSEDPATIAAARAYLHRKSIEQLRINGRHLQDMHIFGNIAHVPVIYIEHQTISAKSTTIVKDDHERASRGSMVQSEATISQKVGIEKLPPKFTPSVQGKNKRALRVVIFVHGFQGHHLDLRLVRNQWLLIDPGAECVMSEANEDRTASDFRELGKRLAEEVKSFLKNKFSSPSKIASYASFKLSFVGHSIGNVIIRSALADAAMKPYLKNLYTFLSISGPHLGYLYSSNALFNSGLWILKKLKGSACMHQLTFTDEPDIRDSFLFRLSQERTLDNFQSVILVSSPQDRYVPYHSARIEMCHAANRDSKKGAIYANMFKNCLDQILLPTSSDRTFVRADVNFDATAQSGTLNNYIGRAAHIEFLESDLFARFLMWSFPKLFL